MNAVGASVWGRLLSWADQSAPADRYARLRRMPHSRDETKRIDVLLTPGKSGAGLCDDAFNRVAHRIRASRLLFVPALLSGIALKASQLRLIEYLTHQVRFLRDEGFDADIAQIDTGATVERNADCLAEIIVAHHRPTWVITHSKGGLDFLHMLVAHGEAVRFIDGWISFQAPFMGSPVADVAMGSVRARKIGGAALKMLGAEMGAIEDLCTDRRMRYMDEHATRIAQLVDEIPIVCAATRSAPSLGFMPDLPTGRWLDRLGLENDGLVPVNSAILPGARHATLGGLSHGQVATRHLLSRRKFEQVDLLKALFAVALNRQAGSVDEVAA